MSEEKSTKVKARIVGPSAPSGHGQDGDSDSEQWGSIREAMVTLSKRLEAQKSHFGQDPLPAPAGPPSEEDAEQFGPTNMSERMLEPPFPLDVLCSLFENSNALRQNVDAMATNVDGFGHRFEGVIDFSDPEVNNKIRDIMLRQKLSTSDIDDLAELTLEKLKEIDPTQEEVEQTKELWERVAPIEKGRIEAMFDFINPQEPFAEIRQEMRQSLELMGNAAWEVIRQKEGDVDSRILQVHTVPFTHMRLIQVDQHPTEIEMRVKRDPVTYETIKVDRFFRRFVRMSGGRQIYYKEFGDPRVMGRETGARYKTAADYLEAEGREFDTKDPETGLMTTERLAPPQASELYHWKIRSPITPYGVPRWIGVLLEVLGSRASSEVNFLYFDNKAIPPMVMLVSGGRLTDDSVHRIESHIEDRLKGRKNFHKILILEALPANADVTEGDLEASGKMRIELRPLMGDQPQDALFQTYDDNNRKKVGWSFRQPQLLTGDTRDMNRATSQVAKAFAEEQIYQPARDSFDAVMNRHFLPSHRVRFWKFKTNAPVQRMPDALVANVMKSLIGGAIVPNEERKLLSDAFSLDLDYREESWAQIPPALAKEAAKAGMLAEAEPLDGGMGTEVMEGEEGEEEGDEKSGDGGTFTVAESRARARNGNMSLGQIQRRNRSRAMAKAFAVLRESLVAEVHESTEDFFGLDQTLSATADLAGE